MAFGFKVPVDAGLIGRAADELYECLLAQNLAYINRFYSGGFVLRAKRLLRNAGLTLSLFGLLLCVALGVAVPRWCPAWLEAESCLPLFAVSAVFFYFLPKLDPLVRRWTEARAGTQCRRRAERAVSRLRKLIPLTVEYSLRGDLLICLRNKDDRWALAWSKRLGEWAYEGEAVVAVFRKSASLVPYIIVLHRRNSALAEVLRQSGVRVVPLVNPARRSVDPSG